MTSIRLEDFGGLIPRQSDRLLPPTSATIARNVKLLSGEIRGLRVPRLLQDFSLLTYDVKRAYRWEWFDEDTLETHEFWQTFADPTTDVIRSSILNDQYDRYYWTGESYPQPVYNTRQRIIDNQPPYYLGVPQPDTAPTCTETVVGTGEETTRAYVYTFVSAYGEEGPPSEPTLITCPVDSTVTLSDLDITPADALNRNIVGRKIYRTIVGNSNTSYFYVGEIDDMVTTEFVDDLPDDVVALNNILESVFWQPPPRMDGWVMMPNGFMVGWRGKTIMFSDPYRPHAWPVEYQISTEFEVVGMVVWGTALVIGTKSQPYLGQGVVPQSFTTQKMDAIEPCLSRRGMVATVAGAYYPSLNGIVMVNAGGINVITTDVLTKEEWENYNPADIFAAPLGLQYIAFNAPNFGFVFNPTEPKTKLVELDFFDQVSSVATDKYTGNVYIVRASRVFEWDPNTDEKLYWQWRSKEFHLPKPLNFGAVKIKFLSQDSAFVRDPTNEDYLHSFNEARFAGEDISLMTDFTLTMGFGVTDPISYGFSVYDAGVSGYPPYGLFEPEGFGDVIITFFTFYESGSGFTLEFWATTADDLPPPSDSFSSIGFTDDDDTVWTFERADANNPDGVDVAWGTGEIRMWVWDIDPSALPVVTEDTEYVISVGEPVPNNSLNTLNAFPLGLKARPVEGWTEAQNRGPLGGSELYNLAPATLQQPAVARFRAWAGGQLTYDNTITNESILRMPTGFKRDIWQFELASNSNVFSVQIAETGRELEKV